MEIAEFGELNDPVLFKDLDCGTVFICLSSTNPILKRSLLMKTGDIRVNRDHTYNAASLVNGSMYCIPINMETQIVEGKFHPALPFVS